MQAPNELAGDVDQAVYIPLLKKWFWSEMHFLCGMHPATGHGLLMGCPLWGNEFIDRFAFFCLPSIRAPKNLAALKDRCTIVLYTDEAGFDRLWLMKRDLRKKGLLLIIRVIPAAIFDHMHKSRLNKYWLLGTVQNILVQMAGEWGMGFHMLMPDHLYAHEYFPNLLRLAEQFEGIAQTSISGDIEKCLPELEQWRRDDGSLEIPDRDLGDLAFRHLHKQSQISCMNGVDLTKELPDTHFLFWVGKDRLHLYCCHMSAAYMSAAVCARAPIRLHNALDTELPAFMPENVCIPEPEDGMTFIELSDDTKLHGSKRVQFSMFALRCWSTVHYALNHMPFFEATCEVPIKEQAQYVERETIEKVHATLVAALKVVREPILEAVKKERSDAEAAAGQKGMAEVDHEREGSDGAVRLRGGHPVVMEATNRHERRRAAAGAG